VTGFLGSQAFHSPVSETRMFPSPPYKVDGRPEKLPELDDFCQETGLQTQRTQDPQPT